jgi:hypothetical protein
MTTDKAGQNDRELLELAAKAAGIEVTPNINGWEEKYPIGWNPLTDDGDALRLAVKLGMKIYPGEAYPWNEEYADWPIQFGCAVDEDEEPDSYAATRRAIVRAAASIGETL